jgi:hypothetical protein
MEQAELTNSPSQHASEAPRDWIWPIGKQLALYLVNWAANIYVEDIGQFEAASWRSCRAYIATGGYMAGVT